MHMKEDAINDGLTKPGYNLQIATENQFITNFALFPNPTDTLTYIPFMESFRERYGHFASTEVADSGYGSEENYEFMELYRYCPWIAHTKTVSQISSCNGTRRTAGHVHPEVRI